MRILFIGDIVGKAGRLIVKEQLPELRQKRSIDFVIANGENTAHGKGITPKTARELFESGIDVLTGGNHTFRNREALKLIEEDPRVLRPENYPPEAPVPGSGSGIYQSKTNGQSIAVGNIQGRAFMSSLDCPFRAAQEMVNKLSEVTPLIVIDMHAEATSEKIAMKWHLDGQITLLIGTHTHVATADSEVTGRGTAYQTDAGMTGSHDGVLGIQKEIILKQLIHQMPVRHELSTGDLRMNAVLIDADVETGRALNIERIMLRKEGS